MPSASSNKRLYGEVNDEPASAKRSRLSGSGGTAATTVSGLPPTLRAPTCAAPVPNTSRLDSEARAGAHLPCDLRSANTVTGISIQDTIVNDPAQANEPELWASDTETLVSEAAADLSGNELGSRAVARKPSTHSEYALRFRVDTYRPAHGGVYAAGRDGPAPATTQGTLKSDVLRAVQNAQTDGGRRVTNASHQQPLLDRVFAGLSTGLYPDAPAHGVLAFALSRHYPIKQLVASYLDEPDAHVLRALRAAEKHGYRVSLAQLEVSHFGNPFRRRWRDASPVGEETETLADVRAIRARAYAFRDPGGQRVFGADSEMLLPDACVLNGDMLWDAPADTQVSHRETADGLGAYYDIERRFLRTAVILWRTVDQGAVMLEYSGAEAIARHLALIDALSPEEIAMLHRDVVDPVLEDALLMLEEPTKSWRNITRRDGRRALRNTVLHIAACRGVNDVATRIAEIC